MVVNLSHVSSDLCISYGLIGHFEVSVCIDNQQFMITMHNHEDQYHLIINTVNYIEAETYITEIGN